MFQFSNMKTWVNWSLVRAHLCTLAVSVTLHGTWRAPRDAYRYGGVQYALVTTAAMLVCLPLVLLQLALGQLSQQDTVGIWRAVPFFKGVGYLRLLVSFVGCVYTIVHMALTLSYFLYSLSNSIPFDECTEIDLTENGLQNMINATDCMSSTFMAPVSQRPEYFISMSLIMLFLWIALPFLLFSPVKLMKRTFYVLGPTLVVAGVVVAASVGSGERLAALHEPNDWALMLQPRVWLGALAQALLSTQVAGGYLISAGDSIYSSANVQWTAIAFVSANIVGSWASLLFWFGVTGGAAGPVGSAAVLVQMYQVAEEERLPIVWPLLVYAALFLSGIITILTFLYPVQERIRRAGGARWRVSCAVAAAAGAALSVALLAGHEPALAALEEAAVPLLVTATTVLEILAFVFIYGWKALIEDVEFLTGQDLSKYWVMGWCAAPGVVVPLGVWWLVDMVTTGTWAQPPWSASVVVAATTLVLLVVVVFAAVVVARQVQYDIIGKLKSSFQPSRHWGPRDPITHYYWLARREEADRGQPRTRYQRRQAGQLAGTHAFLSTPLPLHTKDVNSNDLKRRSNSDDWIYTVYRRKYLEEVLAEYVGKSRRSMSLDWAKLPRVKKDSIELKILGSTYLTPIESAETVFKDAISDVKKNISFSC